MPAAGTRPIKLSRPLYVTDAAGARVVNGYDEPMVIWAERMDRAGRIVDDGEIETYRWDTMFIVTKAGLEALNPEWRLEDADGNRYEMRSVLEERDFPLTQWAIRAERVT